MNGGGGRSRGQGRDARGIGGRKVGGLERAERGWRSSVAGELQRVTKVRTRASTVEPSERL